MSPEAQEEIERKIGQSLPRPGLTRSQPSSNKCNRRRNKF
jgi:hypothetical protein